MQKTYETGYAIEKNVEAVVNSANDGLLLGTSGAGKIKTVTGFLKENSPQMQEYESLCHEIGRLGKFCKRWQEYDKVAASKVQLECLRIIKNNEGKPLKIGLAEMTSSGDFTEQEGKPKYIIHAIGMGYEWPEFPIDPVTKEPNKRKEIQATPKSVSDALTNTFELVKKYEIRSIAIPIMCARVEMREGKPKVYGLTPKQSYEILEEIVTKNEANLDKVIICGDNESTSTYLKEINKI